MAPELIHLDAERIARRGDTAMTGAEKVAEAEWLLDGGIHPDHIAAQLGTNVLALIKACRDYGRKDLGRRLSAGQIRHDRLPTQGERRRAA
ncbi:MAG: hypothetical protein BGN97_03565 [Microbacterium sp. 69-10]|uniref:hypothetical protein n=1 Tax=Microbacterium sp. 69-10 TaxID=1895783 RepID=UPI000967D595|nr:hypothetical protein [Microbacterium sp. 69-10]OJU41795.1 MAG: hypothetical protein BGN97_03565 [Microbacterium sp. 69-10]